MILLALLLAVGFPERLWHRNDPDVDEGNTRALQNDPEGAMNAYDRALERHPDSAELHLNRAGQLLKLGSDHAKQAHDESLLAMQSPDRVIKERGAFDLGLSYEAMGNPDEAMKAYQQALTLDPSDRDAKANLELLLKTQQQKKPNQQQQEQQQSKDQKQDQKQEQQKSKGDDQQQKQQQQQAGDQQEQKKQEQQEPQQAKPEEKKQQQAQEQKPVDRSEAERLLDALRAGEKNLQVWRFAKEKRKDARRGDVEKDW